MPDLAVTLIKSPIGNRPQTRATVAALGLRRLNQTVVVADNESHRGMLTAIAHLITVSEGKQPVAAKSASAIQVRKQADTASAAQPAGSDGKKKQDSKAKSARPAASESQLAGKATSLVPPGEEPTETKSSQAPAEETPKARPARRSTKTETSSAKPSAMEKAAPAKDAPAKSRSAARAKKPDKPAENGDKS